MILTSEANGQRFAREGTIGVNPPPAQFLKKHGGASSVRNPVCQSSGLIAMKSRGTSHERTPVAGCNGAVGPVKRLVFHAGIFAAGAGGQDQAALLSTWKPKTGFIGWQTLAALAGSVAPTTTSGAQGQSLEEGRGQIRKETLVTGWREI